MDTQYTAYHNHTIRTSRYTYNDNERYDYAITDSTGRLIKTGAGFYDRHEAEQMARYCIDTP